MDIETAKEIIVAAAIADDTVIIEGVHGIGKSGIVKQFATENNYHIETLFLSHQEVGDITGIPKMIEKNGSPVTIWSMPIWLQRMHLTVWPNSIEMDDIIFHDKEFEKYVKDRFN